MSGFCIVLALAFTPPVATGKFVILPAILQEAEDSFAKGLALKNEPDQARKHFRAAADAYRQLYQQGVRSAALCRNWGNAELLADRLPEAVLAWRLGLLLAPGDPELLANLEYARDQVAYPPGEVGRPPAIHWPAWVPWPGFDTLLLAAFFGYALTWVFVTGWLITRGPWWLALAGGSLIMFLGLAAGALVLGLAEHEENANPLVVIAEEHTLHRGNGKNYPPHDNIPEVRPGMEARLLFQRGDWLQIELGGGHVGWVPRQTALVSP